MPKSIPVHKEEVLREFPALGKYKVRLLRNPRGPEKILDIREHVETDQFSGYTRRGIRLSNRAQIDLLRDTLTEIQRDLLM